MPECIDSDHFYYREKKVSWTTIDEVRNRTKQAVKGKQAYVSVNWPQAVLRVRFKDGAGEEQLEMEEANEGEQE